jgi:ACS family glucarate transporter-like MFS transporter
MEIGLYSKLGFGRHRWVIVTILCAVAFVLYVDRINISVSAPHLAAEFRLSSQSLGNVLSAFLFGYAFGLVPGGWLADRFGAHKVLTVAGLLWAILTFLMGFVPSTLSGTEYAGTVLFLMRFALGLAEACSYPTFARALANWMRRSERALASGLIHMGSNLGGIFTPVFIAAIISHFGWRYSFLFSALVTLAAVLWWWRTGTDEPTEDPRVSPAERRLITSDREELQVEKTDRSWFKRLARSREAYLLCSSCFFLGLSSFVFLTWFYTYLVQVRGSSDLYSAVLTSLTYVAGAVGALLGGILCDASVKRWGSPWGRRIVPFVSITVSGLLCILAPMIRNNTGSAALFALAAGLQVVPAPAFWATIIDITRRGPAIVGGFMNGLGNLGAALGTIAFPWLISQMDWQLALQAAGSTGIISGLLWLLIDSSRQIDSPPRADAPAISVSTAMGTAS